MKKRARLCFYIFIACAFFALGILGYFVFNTGGDNVMVGSKKFVTFNEVPNAYVYSLSVNNSTDDLSPTYTANYKISKKQTNNNEYHCLTQVEIENKKVAEEEYIQKITAEYNNKINCIIKDYKVTFFDAQGKATKTAFFEEQTLNEVDKDIVCCVLSEYFEDLFIKDAKYHVVCNALNESGETIEQSEFEYDYYAYYKDDFLRRKNFFMDGAWYDYVISTKEELKELVWHTILYRQNDVSFYIEGNKLNSGNVYIIVIEAINDYPEYDGLEEADNFVVVKKNIGKLINFNYFLDFNFTKTFEDLKTQNSKTYEQAEKELHKKDDNFFVDYEKKEDESPRTFAIDERQDEVLVYNTEQLVMAVQYGAKPVFVDSNDPEYLEDYEIVKIVYNNALQELRKINNSNSLSDYEKALNIYRYLCQNVVYDYVTYNYMILEDDFSISNFGNINCFYLEGVFLDLENQYAVCDGIAKAYTLLCNIEGIDCVKVNGEIISSDGGNHAWNKVCLTLDQEEGAKWYYVDATWGVATYSVERTDESGETYVDNFEFLTHTYFLTPNSNLKSVEFESELDTSSEGTFDYYQNSTFDYNAKTHNYLVSNKRNLENIVGYAQSKLVAEDSVVVEFKKGRGCDRFVDELFANISDLLRYEQEYQRTHSFVLRYNIDLLKAQIDADLMFAGVLPDTNYDWFLIGNNVLLFRFYK